MLHFFIPEEISNDAKESDGHQKEHEGHDGLRPYQLLKHNLHQYYHHHHHNKGKIDIQALKVVHN